MSFIRIRATSFQPTPAVPSSSLNAHKINKQLPTTTTTTTTTTIMPPAMLRRKALKGSYTNSNSMNDSIIFDFDCQKLEDFMFSSMVEYCQDSALIRSAKKESIGLAERMETQPAVGLNVIEILHAFMNVSPRLPTELVYQCHCYIGLLWIKSASSNNNGTSSSNKANSIASAQCSFTKALWIAASSATDRSATVQYLEQVALTMHRLARLEGEGGNYSEAIALVQKAVEKYETVLQRHNNKNSNNNSNNMMGHQLILAYIADARNAASDWHDRHGLQAAAAAATAAKTRQSTSLPSSSLSRHSQKLKRLSFVREDSSTESSREFHLKH
jgi:hypothetical protein